MECNRNIGFDSSFYFGNNPDSRFIRDTVFVILGIIAYRLHYRNRS